MLTNEVPTIEFFDKEALLSGTNTTQGQMIGVRVMMTRLLTLVLGQWNDDFENYEVAQDGR